MGSVEVQPVNLHTCWLLGCQKAACIIPEAKNTFNHLFKAGFDMMSPFGILLVNQHNLQLEVDDEYNCSELEIEYALNLDQYILSHESTVAINSTSPENLTSCTHDGDVEDTIAEEYPWGPITAKITINGLETTKPKALHLQMMYRSNHASTDCLKCVQNMPCFAVSSDLEVIAFDSTLGGPCL